MDQITLPPSPNWYLSGILDCCYDGTVAWGCSNNIAIGTRPSTEPSDWPSLLQYSIIRNAHKGKVLSVSFAPRFESNDRLLASTGDDGIVKVWSLETLSTVYTYHFDKKNRTVAAAEWSRKQPFRLFCLSGEGLLVSWNARYNSVDATVSFEKPTSCLSCCPHNADLIAVGSKTGLVYIVNICGKPRILYKLRGHDTEIVSLSWCPSPRNVITGESENVLLLASGAKDKSVFIWRAGQDGRCAIEIPLPVNPLDSRRHRSKLSSSVGSWIPVKWVRPKLLLASSLWGELISWNFDSLSKGKPRCGLIHASHGRGLFSIAQWPSESDQRPDRRPASGNGTTCNQEEPDHGDNCADEHDNGKENWRETEDDRIRVWTSAQDRQIVCCAIHRNTVTIEYSVATQCGPVVCIAPCPLETSRIAFGGYLLQLWTLSSGHRTTFEVVTLWQKIQGKIRSLAWHPEKENLLAYATEEGRVGVFDTNANKPPTLYKQYHRNIVYSLGWGPNSSTSDSLYLYSCTEGELVSHDPRKPGEDPSIVLAEDCTEFSWKPDFSCLAVGYKDGSISFFDRDLKLRGCAKPGPSKKMVYCLAWHPESTAADETVSPFRNYLAMAAGKHILVYDLSNFVQRTSHSEQQDISNSNDPPPRCCQVDQVVATLSVNLHSVVCLAWSPYFTGHLASGSYDHTAQVWNVETKELMATYTGHFGPVLCCMWSPLHPDFVITGSMDGTLRVWNTRDQKPMEGGLSCGPVEKREKRNKGECKDRANLLIGRTAFKSDEDHSERQVVNTSHGFAGTDQDNDEDSAAKRHDETVKSVGESERKRIGKERYFGKSDPMNNEKLLLDAMVNILVGIRTDTTINEKGADQEEDRTTTIFPLLDRDEQRFRKFLSDERERCMHAESGQFEMAAEMSLWSGNLKEELEEAAKQKRLNDCLISLAPSLSTKIWRDTCEAYANQLIGEGKPVKAASYLLGIHQIHKAIETLQSVDLYKEAYTIARCKLSPDDSTLKTILENWAAYCDKTGQLLKAAYIYMELRNFSKASQYLARRKDARSLELRAELALLSGNETVATISAEQAIELVMLSESEYEAAWSLTKKFPQLKHKEIQLRVLEELQKRVIARENGQLDAVRDWLQGNSGYSLLETLKTRCGSIHHRESHYSRLQKSIGSSNILENEKTLWLAVSNEIGMAVIRDHKEEQWKHVLNALASLSQFETLHRRIFEDVSRDSLLIKLITSLETVGPTQPESMFAKSENCLSTSLRAYLCLGLLTWLLQEYARHETFNQDHLRFLPLVQDLLVDVFDESVIRHYSAETEIAKLKSRLSPVLCESLDEVETEGICNAADKGTADVARLVQDLNRLRIEKKRFSDERVAAPNPMIVYGKANQLLDKLPDIENLKGEYSEALGSAWTRINSIGANREPKP